jgi:uroporphyrinogen-III synthase
MMPGDNSKFKIQNSKSGSTSLPVYLFSKTPHPDAIHIPILCTTYLKPEIDFESYDGIILTSKEAVEALEALGGEWKRLPLLCVGAKTAEHARRCGGRVLQSANGYGDELEGLVLAHYAGLRWLYARPRKVASDFAARLRRAGVAVDEAVLYETRCNETAKLNVEAEAVLAFTSPSAVSCFRQRCSFQPTHRVVVIGTTTLAALPEGVNALMPKRTSVEELVHLAAEIAQNSGGF